MRYIEDLKRNLCEELEKYGQKENLSVSDLERVDTLAHAVKNLDKILMCEDGGYSQSGDWYAMGKYGRNEPDYHHGGDSYRGRSRDSMGRYSRNDAKNDIAEKLRHMASEAPDNHTREALEKAMRAMED